MLPFGTNILLLGISDIKSYSCHVERLERFSISDTHVTVTRSLKSAYYWCLQQIF